MNNFKIEMIHILYVFSVVHHNLLVMLGIVLILKKDAMDSLIAKIKVMKISVIL